MSRSASSSKARNPKSSTDRMAAYRRRQREAGLRPVQIWVPDLRKPDILAEYRRQAQLIAHSDVAGTDALEWIEAAYGWPAP